MEGQIVRKNNLLSYFIPFLLILIFSFSFASLRSQDNGNPDRFFFTGKDSSEFNAEQIIEMSKPSLISIWFHTSSYSNYSSYDVKDTTLLNGSGFIFGEDGLVGTNYHVVDGIDSLLVKTSDGTFFDAQLLLLDEKNDICKKNS